MLLRVRVHACVRSCVRACVRACVRVQVNLEAVLLLELLDHVDKLRAKQQAGRQARRAGPIPGMADGDQSSEPSSAVLLHLILLSRLSLSLFCCHGACSERHAVAAASDTVCPRDKNESQAAARQPRLPSGTGPD
jgi:hypothetical protein